MEWVTQRRWLAGRRRHWSKELILLSVNEPNIIPASDPTERLHLANAVDLAVNLGSSRIYYVASHDHADCPAWLSSATLGRNLDLDCEVHGDEWDEHYFLEFSVHSLNSEMSS
jgi:hypothetical protein